MKDKQKPKVGQILYSLNINNASRNTEQKLTQVIVISVGRKYFKTTRVSERSSVWDVTYYLSNWREKTNYCENSKLYVSKQEWLDERESNDIHKELRNKYFDRYGQVELPLGKLRAIKEITEG